MTKTLTLTINRHAIGDKIVTVATIWQPGIAGDAQGVSILHPDDEDAPDVGENLALARAFAKAAEHAEARSKNWWAW